MRRWLIFFTFIIFTNAKEQTIGFAAGCFWGVEKHFEGFKGVKSAISGYAGGNFANPSYKKVLSYRYDTPKGIVNYAETVKVVYDDNKITTRDLIKSFWEMHDPTQKNRQGNDRGNNYRSAIFYTTNEQKQIALQTKAEYQKLLSAAGYGEITTKIEPLKHFYRAEEYHQDYLKKHPNGYCPNHATGVKFKAMKAKSIKPLGGKEIVVVDAKDCPFCEKFKKDVVSGYNGQVPLRVAKLYELKGFKLKTKLDATPTILFIVDGKEVFAHRGYWSAKEFYKALGAFKLGKGSEAFRVAFNKGTDARFCKRYEKFKHTGDGVFIDTLSGDVLFDTKDRFNSGSGWLSFYRAVPGSVEFREDNSYGMHRVEVIAKKSGIHLGHVFDRADGRKRFCINATVLEFVPREKLKK